MNTVDERLGEPGYSYLNGKYRWTIRRVSEGKEIALANGKRFDTHQEAEDERFNKFGTIIQIPDMTSWETKKQATINQVTQEYIELFEKDGQLYDEIYIKEQISKQYPGEDIRNEGGSRHYRYSLPIPLRN